MIQSNIISSKWLICGLSAALWHGTAWAQTTEALQPAVPATPTADAILRKAQEEAAQKSYAELLEKGRQESARKAALTPEQRQQEEESEARSKLTEGGINDKSAQDALFKFLKERDAARQSVRQVFRKLYDARRLKISDRDMAVVMNDYLAAYLAAVEAEQARSRAATAELDKAIQFSAQPRIRAFLIINGYIGDAVRYSAATESLERVGVDMNLQAYRDAR